MKHLILIAALIFSATGFANTHNPRWTRECTTSAHSPARKATMYAMGNVIFITMRLDYELADLICSFDGPCTGFVNGAAVAIPNGSTKLNRSVDGRILGFTYRTGFGLRQHGFTCN